MRKVRSVHRNLSILTIHSSKSDSFLIGIDEKDFDGLFNLTPGDARRHLSDGTSSSGAFGHCPAALRVRVELLGFLKGSPVVLDMDFVANLYVV